MRNVTLALSLAACLYASLALAPDRYPEHVVAAALAAVAVGVAAACAAAWLPIALGALSPLALAALERRVRLDAAIATLAFLWLSARLSLARERRHLVAALVCDAAACWLAGVVVASFAGERASLLVTACVFAGAALALAAELTPADTPTASALSSAGRAIGGDIGVHLERAAELHRRLARSSRAGADRDELRALIAAADRRAALDEGTETTRRDADVAITSVVARLEAADRSLADVAGRATAPDPRLAWDRSP